MFYSRDKGKRVLNLCTCEKRSFEVFLKGWKKLFAILRVGFKLFYPQFYPLRGVPIRERRTFRISQVSFAFNREYG